MLDYSYWTILVISAGVFDWFRSRPSSSPAPSWLTNSTPTYQPDFHWQNTSHWTYSARNEQLQVREQAGHALMQRQFSALESELHQARSQKEMLPGGWSKLTALYQGISRPMGFAPMATPPCHVAQSDWQKLESFLLEWIEQIPASTSARIALAECYINWAWEARGSGFADTVEAEAWEIFEQRLDEAEHWLAQLNGTATECAHWHACALLLSRGKEWQRAQVNQVFDAGCKLDPTYPELYRNYLAYLLPQWFGEEGEWLRELVQLAQQRDARLGKGTGSILLYQTTAELFRSVDLSKDATTLTQIWPQMKAGLHALAKKYELDATRANQGFYWACLAGDMATAQLLAQQLNDQWQGDLWQSESQFHASHQWVEEFCRKHNKT